MSTNSRAHGGRSRHHEGLRGAARRMFQSVGATPGTSSRRTVCSLYSLAKERSRRILSEYGRNIARSTAVSIVSKTSEREMNTNTRRAGLIASLTAGIALAHPAMAAEFEVHMLNHGQDGMMRFDPQLLKIAPGDTVHFVATDKGHNAEIIPGMIPDGAKPFSSTSGEDMKVTFTVPGVYGYRCTPHGSLGM